MSDETDRQETPRLPPSQVLRFPSADRPHEPPPLLFIRERIEDDALKASAILRAALVGRSELAEEERQELLRAALDYLNDIEEAASGIRNES